LLGRGGGVTRRSARRAVTRRQRARDGSLLRRLARALLASAGLNRQGERGHSRAIFAAQPATYCLREQMYIAGTLVSALAVA